MKLTKDKVLALDNMFDEFAKVKTNVKFLYTVHKNKRILETEVKSLMEAKEPTAKYMEFQQKRIALCEEHCERNEQGRPVMTNVGTPQQSYVFSEEKRPLFEGEVGPLKEEYKEEIEEQEEKEKQFFELLKEEVELELCKFKLDIMPEKVFGQEMDLLFDLIEE